MSTKSGEVNHGERDHSKFSASGSERWLNCAASVELEENSPPSIDTVWSKEGTKAHELLELVLRKEKIPGAYPRDMHRYVRQTAQKVFEEAREYHAPLLIEKRVFNNNIHPEMFGTVDVIIPQVRGTLLIRDFKYGKGHVVNPIENTQLIQYALGAADAYDWEFERVDMGILQPRAGGEWFKTWEISITELKNKWLPIWKKGVARVERGNNKPFPGSWCHWCRAKNTCPAKQSNRFSDIENRFSKGIENGKKETEIKSKSKTEKSEGHQRRVEKAFFRKAQTFKADKETGGFGW